MAAPLVDVAFAGAVIEWRGPAPFFFVAVPSKHVAAIRDAARTASYGWGVVPVAATIGGVTFTTALFPRDGRYLLPLKNQVRRATGVVMGDAVEVGLKIWDRDDR